MEHECPKPRKYLPSKALRNTKDKTDTSTQNRHTPRHHKTDTHTDTTTEDRLGSNNDR